MTSFAIVGAGAVGSYYGGRLAEAGNDVRFLLRSDFQEVSEHGLKVESSHGDFHLPKVTCAKTPEEIGKVDVVIVAWKTTANAHFEKVISPMMHENSLVLTLQNGLGNVEILSEIFGEKRVLGALCYVCINRISPGLIRHTNGGPLFMGAPHSSLKLRLEELGSLFKKANIICEVVSDLGEAQWRKLVWNIPFNGLCITEGGIDTQALLSLPYGVEKVRALMAEVLLAASALGHEIEASFAEDKLKMTYPMGPYRPSSMIDFVEGREVEVEPIWGESFRQAKAAGAEVPLMEALYHEVKNLTESKGAL